MNYYRIHFKNVSLEINYEHELQSLIYWLYVSSNNFVKVVDNSTGGEKLVRASEIYLVEQIF